MGLFFLIFLSNILFNVLFSTETEYQTNQVGHFFKKNDLSSRKDIRLFLKKNPQLRNRIKNKLRVRSAKNRKPLLKNKGLHLKKRKQNDFHQKEILKKNKSIEDIKEQTPQLLEDFLSLILPNFTQYFHIYKYIFFMMNSSLSFRHDIKTFSKEKEIRDYLAKTASMRIDQIKKLINFDIAKKNYLIKSHPFFEQKKNIQHITETRIYVGKKMYDELIKNDFFVLENMQNVLLNKDFKDDVNNIFIRAFSNKIEKKSPQELFFVKLFSVPPSGPDIVLFDYLKLLFFVYEYAVGLEEKIVSEKDFFGTILKNTEKDKSIQRENIFLVKKALANVKVVIDALGSFIENPESKESSFSFAEVLKQNILKIEKEGETNNEERSYLKIGLGLAMTAGALFFLGNNKNILEFGTKQLLNVETFFPQVTTLFQSAASSIKNSLFFWNANSPLSTKIYRGLTFGIGDKMLQAVHQFANTGIDQIGEKTKSEVIKKGSSFLLGVGLEYYFDSWFTGYFVSLFGKKASKIFNFSLFNEAKNIILDFIFSLKIFYRFDVASLPIDASLALAESYSETEYIKGILIAILADQKAKVSGLIGTFKTWALDRFL
jgi:hypothetical protein